MVMQNLTNMQMPEGVLGSIFAGQQASQAYKANELERATNTEALDKAYQMNPLDVMVRQKDAMHAQSEMDPAYVQQRLAGLKGEAQSKEAKGYIDYNSMDSNLKKQLAENIVKTSDAEIEATINGIDQFIAKATSGGPAGLSFAMEGLPPEYKQMIQAAVQAGQDPIKLAKDFGNLIKNARADSVKYRSDKNLEDVKGDWDLRKQKEATRGTLGAANIQAGAMDKAAMRERRAMAVAALKQQGDVLMKDYEANLGLLQMERMKRGKSPTKSATEVALEKEQERIRNDFNRIQKEQSAYVFGEDKATASSPVAGGGATEVAPTPPAVSGPVAEPPAGVKRVSPPAGVQPQPQAAAPAASAPTALPEIAMPGLKLPNEGKKLDPVDYNLASRKSLENEIASLRGIIKSPYRTAHEKQKDTERLKKLEKQLANFD
jgi:hypothetical protein